MSQLIKWKVLYCCCTIMYEINNIIIIINVQAQKGISHCSSIVGAGICGTQGNSVTVHLASL